MKDIVLSEGLLVALIGLAGLIVTGFSGVFIALAKTLRSATEAANHARDANDAVNHRHEHNTPRIFDMVADLASDSVIHKAQHKKMDEWCESVDNRLEANDDTHNELLEKVNQLCKPCKEP